MDFTRAFLQRSSRALPVLLALALVLPAGGRAHTHSAGDHQRHVIVDTDMGLDDVRAVFALLAEPTMEIEAFITVEGSAALGKGTDNLVGLLEANRSGSIPVVKGLAQPGLEAPPWRQTANSLAGAPFPPPRSTDVIDFTPGYISAIIDRAEDVEYVALGPLTNLSSLGAAEPGALGRIHAVYIPAVVRDGLISDYNLVYDSESSRAVFESDVPIVILDVSGVEGLDGPAFLASIEGRSLPALYIERLLDALGDTSAHLRLYDDIAAAVLAESDQLVMDEGSFEVRMSGEEGFELVPESDGSVRVARLAETGGALASLRVLLEAGPLDRHSHEDRQEIPAELLITAFHGHLGPYVVLGYRMGRLALSELHSEGHFGISAEVHSPLGTPRSCFIDGVQLGSGCTLGKGNIRVEEAPEPAWAEFTSDRGGQVTIRLRPEIPPLVTRLVNEKGVEAAGHAFFSALTDSLFIVER